MLQAIRDRSIGIIGVVIIGFLIIPFAFTGIYNYLGDSGVRAAAEVNGLSVPIQAVQNEMSRQRQQLQEMFGGSVPDGLMDDAQLRDNALQAIIERELVQQAASEYGYRISDPQLVAQIQSFPAFQQNGAFNPEIYERVLSAQLESKASFENRLRQDMRVQQFASSVPASAFVTEQESAQFSELSGQKRDVAYVLFSTQELADSIQPTDEQIQAYFEEHEADYRSEEQIDMDYVALSADQIAQDLSVSEKELQEFYAQESSRFEIPETRQARHILIKLSDKADDEENQRVDAVLNDIEAAIAEGQDFAELAKQYSEDVLSVNQGGDLGFVGAGDLEAVFTDRLFNLAVGEISEPVRTSLGYQIIKLEAIEPAHVPAFEEVRVELDNEYRQRQAERQFVELSERMDAAAFDVPDDLMAVAAAVGQTVQSIAGVTRQAGSSIANNLPVRSAAFSDDVLNRGRNSSLIELPDGRVVVLRVAAHRPAGPLPLDAVRDQIAGALIEQQAREQAQEKAQSLSEQAQIMGSLVDAASAQSLSLNQVSALGRSDNRVPTELRGLVFRMMQPGGLVSETLASGDVAVVELQKVMKPVSASLSEAETSIISRAYGQRERKAMLQAMQERADIRVFSSNDD